MQVRMWALGVSVCVVLAAPVMSAQMQYPFQNTSLPIEERVSNLLSLLTPDEKIQMLGHSINVPRLGLHAQGTVPTIPGSGGQFEGLHGVAVGGPGNWGRRSPGGTGEHGGESTIATTQFPQAVGLGETWDPDLVEKAADVEGREARFIFQSYDRGGLIIRAPNADLIRDPRWGRAEESYGEDPYLTGTLATAYVRGLTGKISKQWLSISMVKHFMANSNEDNRHGSSSNFDDRLLHEYYARPFEMAIRNGRADAIMASYNAVNRIPMTANPIFRTLVQKKWGFDGLIDTDRGAVTSLVKDHKFYPDMEHAVAGAIHAGVNQFLNPYQEALRAALADHLVTQEEIDENLRGLLRVLTHAGLLDPQATGPYAHIRAGEAVAPWDSPEVKALALKLTQESVVLLKNEPVAVGGAKLLPLNPARLKSIAVVGPLADKVLGDFYGGTPPYAITPLEGVRRSVGTGVDVKFDSDPSHAATLAKDADVAVLVIGNDPACGQPFGDGKPSGKCDPTQGKEAIDRKQINLNPLQEQLVRDVVSVNPRSVVVLVSGFPFTINWAQEHALAIVHMAHSSQEEGQALADVLFGKVNPAGRLVVTWPAALSQLPPMMDYNLRDGRTYMYARDTPLYPFGYGLSYTTFRYSNLRLSGKRMPLNGNVTVKVDVTNTGGRDGDEVVQMYVAHENSAVPRPKEELKGFQRISLAKGERQTVTFRLAASELAYWDETRNDWKVESDRLRIRVGASSSDIRQEAVLTLQ